MLRHFFAYVWKLRDGPARPYLQAFDKELYQTGYARIAACRHLRAAAHLMHWTRRKGLSPTSLNDTWVESFRHHLPQRHCLGYGRRSPAEPLRGARQFLAYLHRAGGRSGVGRGRSITPGASTPRRLPSMDARATRRIPAYARYLHLPHSRLPANGGSTAQALYGSPVAPVCSGREPALGKGQGPNHRHRSPRVYPFSDRRGEMLRRVGCVRSDHSQLAPLRSAPLPAARASRTDRGRL